jgi:hypothetical protein
VFPKLKINFYHNKMIKLSMCLIKHYAIDIWGSGGIAPPFLTLALYASEWFASCLSFYNKLVLVTNSYKPASFLGSFLYPNSLHITTLSFV